MVYHFSNIIRLGCTRTLSYNVICASGDASEMVVMWTTFDPTNESTVQYGEHGTDLTNTANGKMVKFVDGGSEKSVRYMHTVILTGLKPAAKYGKLLL